MYTSNINKNTFYPFLNETVQEANWTRKIQHRNEKNRNAYEL